MNDTLKVAGRIGAELGAAKAELERLRELLRDVEFRGLLTGWEPGLIGQITAALSQQADHVRDAAQMMVPSKILKAIAWGERDDAAEAIGSLRCLLADPEGEDEIAFPDSPEPTDAFTATDMATAAAQGFRDGQAAVEQAPVQDEREAVERFSPTTSVPHCGRASEVEAYMTEDDDGEYMTVSQHERIVAALTRPAQTEQQPVGYQFQDREGVWKQFMSQRHYEDTLADGTWPIRAIYAAPIAQTAPQPSPDALINGAKALLALDESGSLAPHGIGGLAREVIEKLIVRVEQTAPQGKFRMGDLVKKTSGSEWVGHVCGTYSTSLTPEGYAVESEAHAGSVQIYPAKALEAVE